tara:strand:- start:19 stop:291 length:273 start_codon:yes stop_codon:yes gene_type:complete
LDINVAISCCFIAIVALFFFIQIDACTVLEDASSSTAIASLIFDAAEEDRTSSEGRVDLVINHNGDKEDDNKEDDNKEDDNKEDDDIEDD